MKTSKIGSNGNTSRLTGMALLCALVFVLQLVANFVSFGPVNFTLALVPLIVGSAMYGVGASVILGFVFGTIVLISGLTGMDKGFVIALMSYRPIATIFYTLIIIYGKGIAAPVASALVYRKIAPKNDTLAVFIAGIVCPIVNTGIFIVLMLLFFMPYLRAQEAYKTASVAAIVFSFIGVNFITEVIVNVALSSAIAKIIRIVKK